MSQSLSTMVDRALNPALMGWPPMLPYELALREKTTREIVQNYNITDEEWNGLTQNKAFQKALEVAVAELQRDGMGFKIKARLQAEALLLKSWDMLQQDDETVSPAVKADLIKSTVKWAGLDSSREAGGQVGTALQININLG